MFGTQASRDEFDRVIKEWLANGRRLPSGNGATNLTMSELLLEFWNHAKTYYRRPDGTPPSEVKNYADVIRVSGSSIMSASRRAHEVLQLRGQRSPITESSADG